MLKLVFDSLPCGGVVGRFTPNEKSQLISNKLKIKILITHQCLQGTL